MLKLNSDEYAEKFSDVCDAVERAAMGWPPYREGGRRVTSDRARVAARTIFKDLGVVEISDVPARLRALDPEVADQLTEFISDSPDPEGFANLMWRFVGEALDEGLDAGAAFEEGKDRLGAWFARLIELRLASTTDPDPLDE